MRERPHSQSRARISSLKNAQLLAQGKDLKAETETGTEERTERGEESNEIGIRDLDIYIYDRGTTRRSPLST